MLKKDIGKFAWNWSLFSLPLDGLHVSLIAAISTMLKLLNNMENQDESDAVFWNKRLLVVTPHHVQRLHLRNELASKLYEFPLNSSLQWFII
jgi:hypothetical protein